MAELVEAAETVEEVISEVAEAVVIPNVRLIAGTTFVAGLAIGVGAGYFFTKKKLETKYNLLVEEEIDEMRAHFEARELARQGKPDLSGMVEGYKVTDIREDEVGLHATITKTEVDLEATDPVVPPVPQPEPGTPPVKSHYTEAKSVFDTVTPEDIGDGWDFATETKLRSSQSGAPYVIHRSELGEINDWDCTTFTYYEGDDVLCNERDEVVNDREALINASNSLQRFGQGSGDPNVVYVRNTHIEQEFEIVKSDRKYTEDVLGLHVEGDDDGEALQHADIPRRRRPWDDA